MFNAITIIIPTKGRLHNQKTLSQLAPKLLERTIIVVEPDEWFDHYMEYGNKCKVYSLPNTIKGIANKRQHCIDVCKTEYLFMLDDDLAFFKRQEGSVKLDKCSDDNQYNMFSLLLSWMDTDGYPLVGVSARQGNNHTSEFYKEATRQMNFHGIHIPPFRKLNLKFNSITLMEDFHLVLSLLTQGIPNRVLYGYCWNQLGSGAEGGCSTYRTPELQKECAEQLEFDYPDFVTVVEKTNKTGWKGMQTRTDVRVQWKKAYEWGIKNENSNSK